MSPIFPKRIVTGVMMSLTVLILTSATTVTTPHSKQDETKFYVTYGWENANACHRDLVAAGGTTWVFANVVRVDCAAGVFNQFNDHYVAKYGRTRCFYLSGAFQEAFPTYDRAAKHLRELLADHANDDTAPITIDDFEVFCE